MFVAKNIQTDHKDLIHDVSYDFHGRRMATCSSDQYVKVFYYRFLLSFQHLMHLKVVSKYS